MYLKKTTFSIKLKTFPLKVPKRNSNLVGDWHTRTSDHLANEATYLTYFHLSERRFKSFTSPLQLTLFVATLVASVHELYPSSFSSLLMFLQVFLGHPCFIFPSGVQVSASFVYLQLFSILKMWTSQAISQWGTSLYYGGPLTDIYRTVYTSNTCIYLALFCGWNWILDISTVIQTYPTM